MGPLGLIVQESRLPSAECIAGVFDEKKQSQQVCAF
jgi:hypothetical protein